MNLNFEHRYWEIFYNTIDLEYKDFNLELQEFLGINEDKGIVFFLICQFTNDIRKDLEKSNNQLQFIKSFTHFTEEVRLFLFTEMNNLHTEKLRLAFIDVLNKVLVKYKDEIIIDLKNGKYDS